LKYLNRLKKAKLWNIIGVTLIAIGLLVLAPILYFHYTNTGTANANSADQLRILEQAQTAKPTIAQNVVTGFPTAISIPGPRSVLDMNVPVIPGYYNKSNNSWTLTESSAQFAVMSAQPNNITGNTYIYGHYRPEVFAYLHWITPGTIATVTTNNGYQFQYKYVGTYAVQPNDTGVLNPSKSPILTVQTCSGAFFQNRQMYIFSYQNYKKVNA
jgi:sortase (surface protein transpeptidase)